MARRAFRITGRVQGVGFRWFARQAASALGLRGTVRNARDGSVEVLAEGPEDVLAAFEARLRDGPTTARVETVEEVAAPGDDLPPDFRIVR